MDGTDGNYGKKQEEIDPAANGPPIAPVGRPEPPNPVIAPPGVTVARDIPGVARAPAGTSGGTRHGLVVPPDTERPGRRAVAIVSGAVSLTCVVLSIACLVLEHAVTVVSFGGALAIELVVARWPMLYPLASVYWAVAAAIAGWFALSVTRAHVEMPGNWRSPLVFVHRRCARFVGEELLAAMLLGALGLWLQHHLHWPIVAVPLQFAASLLLLRAAAICFVPSFRPWLRLECDLNDGIGNLARLVTQGGVVPRGFITVNHWLLEYALPRYRLLPWLFGYASLVLGFRLQQQGPVYEVVLHNFGPIRVVTDTSSLVGKWKVARGPGSLNSPFPQPMTGWSPSRSGAPGRP